MAPALVLLAACSAEPDRKSGSDDGPNRPSSPNPADTSQAPAGPARQPTESADSRAAEAAREVLVRYFSLVATGEGEEAKELWWDSNRASAFAANLRSLGNVRASVAAPGRIEGAAGSAFVEISLQLLRGSRALSDGTAVLRRVNDVPGSSAEERRWRIDRITLQPPPQPIAARVAGRWASEEGNCSSRAWVFTASSLKTPAGSVCSFSNVREVPGGFDIAASCTAEGPPRDDRLRLRFAESARALLFESDVIADASLVRCR